jgi:hypothetical protein
MVAGLLTFIKLELIMSWKFEISFSNCEPQEARRDREGQWTEGRCEASGSTAMRCACLVIPGA